MISMLGFLILLGTVVNNPILIVDRTLQNLRDGQTSPQQAVTEAVDARLRPIMMSMITTVAGLSPLVFIPGAGTELYRGVGVIVLAGVIASEHLEQVSEFSGPIPMAEHTIAPCAQHLG